MSHNVAIQWLNGTKTYMVSPTCLYCLRDLKVESKCKGGDLLNIQKPLTHVALAGHLVHIDDSANHTLALGQGQKGALEVKVPTVFGRTAVLIFLVTAQTVCVMRIMYLLHLY